MFDIKSLRRNAFIAAGALIIALAALSAWADIYDDWDSVKPPPKPELKSLTLDGSTTALLILDMTKSGSCSSRPRCVATLPNIKRLHDAARAAGAMLWYSVNAKFTPADIMDPGFAPREGRVCSTGRTRQVPWFESGRKTKSSRYQDGRCVWDFVSGSRHRNRIRSGATWLQRDRADRLPVVGRFVHGTVFCLAFLQGRPRRRHQAINADAQHDGEVQQMTRDAALRNQDARVTPAR